MVRRIRYPDAFVVCTAVSPGASVVRDPVVVFETIKDDDVLRMPELDIEIPLPEIYADVALAPVFDEDAPEDGS